MKGREYRLLELGIINWGKREKGETSPGKPAGTALRAPKTTDTN